MTDQPVTDSPASDPETALQFRLAALRERLAEAGVDGFLVPRGDQFLGEYVPASEERLAYISGFTGSAGMAAVLPAAAAVFVDGRYTLQALDESPAALFDHERLGDTELADWLAAQKPDSAGTLTIGYDPKLHSPGWVKRAGTLFDERGLSLKALDANPLDAVWRDRPAPPASPVVDHPLEFAGKDQAEKRAELAGKLHERGLDAAVIGQPDALAWLLNIRGTDVPFTPLALGYGILYRDGTVDAFLDPARCEPGVIEARAPQVRFRKPDAFPGALAVLGRADKKVLADPAGTNAFVFKTLRDAGAEIAEQEDLCLLPKALKNEVEREGARNAHHRDGIALTKFLAWFDCEAPQGRLTEAAAAAKLLEFRKQQPHFKQPSFETISGFGPNGAIVHYRVTPQSDRRIAGDGLYLVDSGGQYLDGTTDVTRTVLLGQATARQRRDFTAVLKGHIAVARARFPENSSGAQIDGLARAPLWELGLDFDHGTGHGVGSYLSVHEGPQRISKAGKQASLQGGMILSDEPGYYADGEYGIRIENLVLIGDAAETNDSRKMLGFETLTLAPIDRRLIEPGMLDAKERAWLDAYHQRVFDEIGPHLDAADRTWLEAACAPLPEADAEAGPAQPKLHRGHLRQTAAIQ